MRFGARESEAKGGKGAVGSETIKINGSPSAVLRPKNTCLKAGILETARASLLVDFWRLRDLGHAGPPGSALPLWKWWRHGMVSAGWKSEQENAPPEACRRFLLLLRFVTLTSIRGGSCPATELPRSGCGGKLSPG